MEKHNFRSAIATPELMGTVPSNSRRTVDQTLIGMLAVGLIAATPAPVSAVPLHTDRPKITTQGHDFGENWDGFGAPLNGARLFWTVSGTNVTTDLEGWQYWKNVSGVTAKIQVLYHDAANHVLANRESTPYAPPSNAKQQRWVDIEYNNPLIDHVHIKLNIQNTSGVWQTVGSVIEFP